MGREHAEARLYAGGTQATAGNELQEWLWILADTIRTGLTKIEEVGVVLLVSFATWSKCKCTYWVCCSDDDHIM